MINVKYLNRGGKKLLSLRLSKNAGRGKKGMRIKKIQSFLFTCTPLLLFHWESCRVRPWPYAVRYAMRNAIHSKLQVDRFTRETLGEKNEDAKSLLVSDRREVHPDIGSMGLQSYHDEALQYTINFGSGWVPLLKSLVESYLTWYTPTVLHRF